MKRFVCSLTAAAIAAAVVLAATSAGPILLAQNTAPNEEMQRAMQLALADNRGSIKVNINSKGIILNGCDTVAFFKEGKPVAGDSAIKSTYQGATYLFASTEDKAEFDKDPAKYAPQYGGFCALGVALGVLHDFESPNDFTIYKGKLYLNGNHTAVTRFRADIDSYIEKAEINWRRLTGS
jgi:YHS domain-containing protein